MATLEAQLRETCQRIDDTMAALGLNGFVDSGNILASADNPSVPNRIVAHWQPTALPQQRLGEIDDSELSRELHLWLPYAKWEVRDGGLYVTTPLAHIDVPVASNPSA